MILVLPVAIGWFAAVLVALLDGRKRWVGWLAVGVLAASLAATVALAREVATDGPVTMVAGNWPQGVGISLHADMLGLSFLLISLLVLLLALACEVLEGVRSRSFPALVLFLATGLGGLFLTGDAFNFYVFFEIAMITSYVLATYGDEPRQLRAGSIFMVVNLLGSVFFLIGIVSLYHITGALDMAQVTERVGVVDPAAVILTATLILVAFSVKLGLFPFHFWLPAVYMGTRPAVAAILSGAVANIGSYGLLRFGGGMLPREVAFAAPALLALGSASILYGALQSISRRSPSEVIAYSSIGQAGYILIAVAIGGPLGFAAAIVYSIVNSLNKTLLFLAVPQRGPGVATAFAIGAFSVAGVPPMAGFWGKASLFRAAVDAGHWWLVVLLFIGGGLSFIYMFQVFQRRYWSGTPGAAGEAVPLVSPVALRALVLGIAIGIVLLGLWPEPLLRLGEQGAAVLAGGAP